MIRRASIGLAIYPDDAATFSDLLHHADRRMYAHKRRLVPHPRSRTNRMV
ncbi:hypothetical protein [Angustibacter speluncae]